MWFRNFTSSNMEIIFLRVKKTCNLLNIYQKFKGNVVRPSQGQNSMCQKAACSNEMSVCLYFAAYPLPTAVMAVVSAHRCNRSVKVVNC
jgi:hypothetical protein